MRDKKNRNNNFCLIENQKLTTTIAATETIATTETKKAIVLPAKNYIFYSLLTTHYPLLIPTKV